MKVININTKADIEEKIKELLPAERDAIVEAVYFTGESAVKYLRGEIFYDEFLKGEQYYETMYGSSLK